MKALELIRMIEKSSPKSAWKRGVKEYALELLEDLEPGLEISNSLKSLHMLLKGADNWYRYSWGGCSLVYDCHIAERLCTQSELKRCNGGERKPNNVEDWLDIQTRALTDAWIMIQKITGPWKELE